MLVEGKNCWKKSKANRVAFLIDGASYFAAFMKAAERARKSIMIAGWDIDSRVSLLPYDPAQNMPVRLGAFLNSIASRRRGLHIYILIWDFSMIFAFEREPLPVFKLGWNTHRRVHFHLDGEHPIGASHHQKLVVVDDRIAFVGGLDFSRNRWDTSEHLAENPERVDHFGRPYPPFHDVQMLVEGQVASHLGDIFRKRWWYATEWNIKLQEGRVDDPWPHGVEPDLTDVDIAIARTVPAYKGVPEVREVERLYLDAIASARKYLYIENQYFTSPSIGKALAARLQEDNGPEIVLILPHRSAGWLEESTMDTLRGQLLKFLHESDRHGRLRVYYPVVPGLGEGCVNVHSKVFIMDDNMVRIGSSNLSSRSMGLDTECDLAFEAAGDPRIEKAASSLRNRLLGEHLGVDPQRVAAATLEKDSLLEAIESLGNSERTLRPLKDTITEWTEPLIPYSILADPERPVAPEQLVEQFVPDEQDGEGSGKRSVALFTALLIALATLAISWQWTSLADMLDLETIARSAASFRQHPLAPLVVIAAYIAGGLAVFPVTILITATGLLFDNFTGFVYALAGCLASATVTYAIGYTLGRGFVRRVAGGRLNRLSKRLSKRGLATVIAVRILPVAPYSIVNLVAGASHIRFRDYILGTLLGMFPGILAIIVFAESVENLWRNPHLENILTLTAITAAIILASIWLQRRLTRKERYAGERKRDGISMVRSNRKT